MQNAALRVRHRYLTVFDCDGDVRLSMELVSLSQRWRCPSLNDLSDGDVHPSNVAMSISQWSWYCIVRTPVCHGFNLNTRTRLEPIGTKISPLVTCIDVMSHWGTSFPRRTLS